MSQTSRSLGVHSTPENAIPQYSDWKTELRLVTSNDADVAAIPIGECVNLAKVESSYRFGSRFGLNTIVLLALLNGTTAKVSLYAREKNAAGTYIHYLVREDTITVNTLLKYENLPPLIYVPMITALTGTSVTLGGGGTM